MTGLANGGTERGTRRAVAADRDAGSHRRAPRRPRRRPPPPPHPRQPAPGLRLRGRPQRLPVLGLEPRRRRSRRLLRPRLLPRLHARLPLRPVAGRDRRQRGRRRRRPDQGPADPGRPRGRLPRLVDGPRARRPRSAGSRGGRGRGAQPDLLVRQRVWGQVDSFGVVFLMLGLRELWRDRPERAAIYTVIAAVIKPQLGILIPLVAVVTIRRALWPERRVR